MTRARLAVRVTNRSAMRAPRKRALRAALQFAARAARRTTADALLVDVTWVADAEMRRLNRQHTGRAGTTDVLSFEDGSLDPELGACRLGDVICNLELAAERARELGSSVEAEAVLYAVHGLLHIIGFDDGAPLARAEMRAAEVSALAAAGMCVKGWEWDRASDRATRRARRSGAGVSDGARRLARIGTCSPSR